MSRSKLCFHPDTLYSINAIMFWCSVSICLFEGVFHAKNEEHFSIRTRHITIKEARKVKEISKKTTRFWPFRITLSQVNQVCQIAPSCV